MGQAEPGVGLAQPELGMGVDKAPEVGGQSGLESRGCSFWVPVFIYKMKRLEGISLLSTVRFHDSVGCFGLTFLLFKCSFIKMVINGLQHVGLCAGCWGERTSSCVKMFTILFWRQIIIMPC